MKTQIKRLAALISAAFMLAGCSAPANTPASSAESAPPATSTPPTAENTLHMLTDPDGFMNVTYTGTENGLYELQNNEDGSANIVYTDYKTLTRNYLCAEPACTHNSESCASYIATTGILTGLFHDQDKLYIFTQPTEGSPTVMRANLDGSNRELFFEFSKDNDFSAGIVSDGNNWYYLNAHPQENGDLFTTVQKFSLATKQAEVLYTFPQLNGEPYYLMGGYGSKLVIKKNTLSDDGETILYTYDFAQNTLQELFSRPKNVICRMNGPELIYCDLAGGEVRGQNVETGEDRSVYQDNIFSKYSTIQVDGVYNNYFLIQVSAMIPFSEFSWDMYTEKEKQSCKSYLEKLVGHSIPEDQVWSTYLSESEKEGVDKAWRYKFLAIDLKGNASQEIALLGGKEQDIPVIVISETTDDFCVVNTYEFVTTTHYDAEGLPYTTEMREYQKAMISKEDYFAQKENYRPITDLTTS